jgi:hypothetical protein
VLGLRQSSRNPVVLGLHWVAFPPLTQGSVMADLIFVAAVVAFFAIALLVLRGLERL